MLHKFGFHKTAVPMYVYQIQVSILSVEKICFSASSTGILCRHKYNYEIGMNNQ